MRIYSLARVLSFPFIVALAILAYMEFVMYEDIGWWLLLPLFGIIAIYMLHGEIDYWWHKKNPIPLTTQERAIITKYIPFYNNLSPSDKEKFENRLSLYMGAREWKNVGTQELKDIPDDMKAMIGSQVTMINFHKKDFLMGNFDRIYTYKHPFPTPRFQFLHTVETDIEDGMILFSMEHVLPGITQPDRFYNIGMHGFAEAFVKQYPTAPYPDVDLVTWKNINTITGFTKEQILAVLGFKQVDLMPVLIMCYFTFPEKLKDILPRIYTDFQKLFSGQRIAI